MIPQQKQTIFAVIGAGNMGSSTSSHLGQLGNSQNVCFGQVNPSRQEGLKDRFPAARFLGNNEAAVQEADVIFLTVKPDQYKNIISLDFAAAMPKGKLFISLISGVSLEQLAVALGTANIIKCSSTLGICLGVGPLVLMAHPHIPQKMLEQGKHVLSNFGELFTATDERDLDEAIPFSGSGFGIITRFAEDWLNAAKFRSLNRHAARRILAHTLIAVGKYLLHYELKTERQIIGEVATKKGMTARMIAQLDNYGFSLTLRKSLQSGRARMRFVKKFVSGV